MYLDLAEGESVLLRDRGGDRRARGAIDLDAGQVVVVDDNLTVTAEPDPEGQAWIRVLDARSPRAAAFQDIESYPYVAVWRVAVQSSSLSEFTTAGTEPEALAAGERRRRPRVDHVQAVTDRVSRIPRLPDLIANRLLMVNRSRGLPRRVRTTPRRDCRPGLERSHPPVRPCDRTNCAGVCP